MVIDLQSWGITERSNGSYIYALKLHQCKLSTAAVNIVGRLQPPLPPSILVLFPSVIFSKLFSLHKISSSPSPVFLISSPSPPPQILFHFGPLTADKVEFKLLKYDLGSGSIIIIIISKVDFLRNPLGFHTDPLYWDGGRIANQEVGVGGGEGRQAGGVCLPGTSSVLSPRAHFQLLFFILLCNRILGSIKNSALQADCNAASLDSTVWPCIKWNTEHGF